MSKLTKLERLLRGEEATYNGSKITGIYDINSTIPKSTEKDNIIITFIDDWSWMPNNLTNQAWDNVKFTEPSSKSKTIKDGLKEGDVIVKRNNSRKVLGVCGKVIFISSSNDYNKTAGGGYTLKELITSNYNLLVPKSTEKPVYLTLQEISDGKGKGIPSHLIKIKE